MENKKTILIIEDDEPIREMYKSRLEAEGYGVLGYFDGQEAVNFIEESGNFDLVLLDIMIPKVSGVDILKNIKGNPKTQNVPVIVMTSLASQQQECMQEGATAYLIKSEVTVEEVVSKVKGLI